jgi:hypothetical protein
MLLRVRDFGIAQAALFPPASLGSEAFAIVAKAIEDLTGHAASQYSGRGAACEGAASKAAARNSPAAGIGDGKENCPAHCMLRPFATRWLPLARHRLADECGTDDFRRPQPPDASLPYSGDSNHG